MKIPLEMLLVLQLLLEYCASQRIGSFIIHVKSAYRHPVDTLWCCLFFLNLNEPWRCKKTSGKHRVSVQFSAFVV